LTLNPDRGFDLSPDPQEEALKRIHSILSDIGETDKTRFIEKIREQSGIGMHKARKLFDIGQGRYWKVEKGAHNKQTVTPIQLFSSSPLYRAEELKSSKLVIQPRRITESESIGQSVNNKELFSYSNDLSQAENQPRTVCNATLTSYAMGRV
jgi:hypothetical protein